MNKIWLSFLFLLSFLPYLVLNRRKSKYYWSISLDNKIPLVPIFVVAYLGYYLFLILGFVLLFFAPAFGNFVWAMITANILASGFWWVFPNGAKRPILKTKDLFSRLCEWVYKTDKYDTNAFPSGHVMHTVIVSFFLYLTFPKLIFVTATVMFLIIISTVLVKQHNLVDIPGGIIFAVAGIFSSSLLLGLTIGLIR